RIVEIGNGRREESLRGLRSPVTPAPQNTSSGSSDAKLTAQLGNRSRIKRTDVPFQLFEKYPLSGLCSSGSSNDSSMRPISSRSSSNHSVLRSRMYVLWA